MTTTSKQTGVYQIKNLVTGKVYVGSAADVNYRWSQHRRLLMNGTHHSRKLQNSWNKHGVENFVFEMRLICAESDLLFYEQRALDTLKAVECGYNISPIAGSPMRGLKHSDGAKAKMSSASLGKPKSEEHATNSSKGHKGVLHPERSERVKKQWETRRLTPVSEETRKKLSEAGKGRPVSEKSRLALIARNKARKGTPTGPMILSDEERQRRIDSNKARAGSPIRSEIKDGVKASKQAAWAERKAKGLHTIRWYRNRGLEIPLELSKQDIREV